MPSLMNAQPSKHDANLQRKDKRRKEAKKHNLKQVLTQLFLPFFFQCAIETFFSPSAVH
jgi:hypothetical protein